ncbi:MAG: LrgB family protein [Alphaproteobacteria bacterium]|nr:LrgB family protein [Alphaproteobacteria bacterium]
MIENSIYFGTALTLISYYIALRIYEAKKKAWFHPVFVSAAIIIIFLSITNVPIDLYNNASRYVMYFLTPATVCLAVPMYKRVAILREHKYLIGVSVLIGAMSAIFVVLGLVMLFKFDPVVLKSIISKSITTGVALGLTEQLGGILPLAAMAVVITGVFGAMIMESSFKVFKITDPIAKGLAAGVSAHVIGTSKALEIDKLAGAISSVAMIITAILTVIIVPIVLNTFL